MIVFQVNGVISTFVLFYIHVVVVFLSRLKLTSGFYPIDQ